MGPRSTTYRQGMEVRRCSLCVRRHRAVSIFAAFFSGVHLYDQKADTKVFRQTAA